MSTTRSLSPPRLSSPRLVLIASATPGEELERSEDAGRNILTESRSRKLFVDSVKVSGSDAVERGEQVVEPLDETGSRDRKTGRPSWTRAWRSAAPDGWSPKCWGSPDKSSPL